LVNITAHLDMSKFINKVKQDLITFVSENTAPIIDSEFLEKGVLTPDEFVEAGDLLVFKCPGQWTWASGDPNKAKEYLPIDKQFLITREPVPCRERYYNTEEENINRSEIVEDDWMSIGTLHQEDNEVVDMDDRKNYFH